MNEKAKAMRREYKRKWNAANKDKVKAAQERYWNRLAQVAHDADETQETTDEPNIQEA